MKRREFLKGVAASAAGAASANATSVISDDLMNSEDGRSPPRISARLGLLGETVNLKAF